jgi:hypothetical protein
VEKHDIGRLEQTINGVRDRLSVLAEGEEYLELIKIIHTPGWTTPAEFRLVSSYLDAITRQIDVVEHLTTGLLEGSRMIAKEHAAV